jgi:hypothetical protein
VSWRPKEAFGPPLPRRLTSSGTVGRLRFTLYIFTAEEPSIRSNSTASSRRLEGNTTVVLLANFRFHRLPLRLSRSAEGSRLALARWLERITDRMEWSR